jgi:hypothetical protein
MNIKRGILKAFDVSSYTASVQLMEATSYALGGIPVVNNVDGSSAIIGAWCAVLFFNDNNPQDAVVIAVFDSVGRAIPTPPAGRLTFVSSYLQMSGATIAAGGTNTYTLTGGISGIPTEVTGIVFKAYFTSVSSGAYIQLAPHGASNIGAYASIGNLPAGGGVLNGGGLLAVDSSGKIDIKANVGNCTVTLYTYGYVS